MNTLLYELEASSYYSYKPGTNEDGFQYYDMRLQNIRKEIDCRFWNKNSIRNKLYHLVEEEEFLIKNCDHPGVPERWERANPKLRYFDCVFDFIENNPEVYERIKAGSLQTNTGITISFKFYPTKEECFERKLYLKKITDKNICQNTHYSYDRIYQNEVVSAFRKVFEADMKGFRC